MSSAENFSQSAKRLTDVGLRSTPIQNFQIKNSDIFHIFAQNIDCATR